MPYIQNSERSIRTPQAYARGHGSAQTGTHHWWMQRVSAIALMLLTAWLVCKLCVLWSLDFNATTAWIKNPINAIGLSLFMMVSSYHGAIGLQVVIEDYMTCKSTKITALMLNHFAFFAIAAVSIFSILTLYLG